jgi:hypothetical protein
VNAEGKPYAGNPHVRFDEGLLARAPRTAGWGLLHHHNVERDRAARGISGRTPGSAARSVLEVRDEREPAVRPEMPAMRRSQPAVW